MAESHPTRRRAYRKDGRQSHPLYYVYKGMVNRCHKEWSKDFPNYGGRGIHVCERWRNDFHAFIADMGERPSPKHQIERIDNDAGYEPGNCRWATTREQSFNRRSTHAVEYRGEVRPIAEWAAIHGLEMGTLWRRIVTRGWDAERAMTEPAWRGSTRNSPRKLSDEDVREIRRLHAEGRTMKSLARQFGVAGPSIRKVVLRQSHKHVTDELSPSDRGAAGFGSTGG